MDTTWYLFIWYIPHPKSPSNQVCLSLFSLLAQNHLGDPYAYQSATSSAGQVIQISEEKSKGAITIFQSYSLTFEQEGIQGMIKQVQI